MIDPAEYVKNNSLGIIVKPGKHKNRIKGYDPDNQVLIVEIKAPARDNKANNEVIRFFSKKLNKKVRIKSGYTSRFKILAVS